MAAPSLQDIAEEAARDLAEAAQVDLATAPPSRMLGPGRPTSPPPWGGVSVCATLGVPRCAVPGLVSRARTRARLDGGILTGAQRVIDPFREYSAARAHADPDCAHSLLGDAARPHALGARNCRMTTCMIC